MKTTSVFRVRPDRPDPGVIQECAAILAHGGLVAFPTETVYGLGAHALDPAAVRRIFVAKGRPADNPLIVHVHNTAEAFSLAASIPDLAPRLAAAFWPGPLTLVLPKRDAIPAETTAGLATFAVRVPSHPVALALLECVGAPLAAPSANTSGRPSPTRAEHVLEDLDGKIDAVLDGGEAGVGLESTVVDVTVTPPEVLRPGGATIAAIGRVAGPLRLPSFPGLAEKDDPPRSPGQKHRHYAPGADTTILTGSPQRVVEAIRRLKDQFQAGAVGFLLSRETARAVPLRSDDPWCFILGSRHSPEDAARHLYEGLRALDRAGVRAIYVEAFAETGLGEALMDRLNRASEGRVLDAAHLMSGDVKVGPASPEATPR